MSRDPVARIVDVVRPLLGQDTETEVVLSPSLGSSVHWRPHLYEPGEGRGWYVLSAIPTTSFWSEIISDAARKSANLQIGLVLPKLALKSEDVLRFAAEAGAQILTYEEEGSGIRCHTIAASAADWIIENNAILPHQLASFLLEREWRNTLTEQDPHRKGRLLWVL